MPTRWVQAAALPRRHAWPYFVVLTRLGVSVGSCVSLCLCVGTLVILGPAWVGVVLLVEGAVMDAVSVSQPSEFSAI